VVGLATMDGWNIRLGWRFTLAVVLAPWLVALPPAIAAGQRAKPKALWQAYPLEPRQEAGPPAQAPPAQARPATSRRASTTEAPQANGGGASPALLLGAAGVVMLLGGGAILLLRDRRRTAHPLIVGRAPEPPPQPAAASPQARGARFARPPSRGNWTCEIEWRYLSPGWGFRAWARLSDSLLWRVIGEAGSFPTRDERDGPDARAAFDALVAALEQAGWRPAEPGAPSNGPFAWAGRGDPARLPAQTARAPAERSDS
jgi:hypothetical protein